MKKLLALCLAIVVLFSLSGCYTREDIETIRYNAREEGYWEGYGEAQEKYYDERFNEGYGEGWDAGYDSGLETGFDNGYIEALDKYGIEE